jgi:hypothetical protein
VKFWVCCLMLLAGVGGGCASAPPRDYYFSPRGDDAAGDGSVARPYKSLAKAGELRFHAGDRLLLDGGAVFDGGLSISGGGGGEGAGKQIYIGSFGTGRATIRAGEGSGLVVRNTGGVVVENLVLVGAGPQRNFGNGLAFVNEAKGAGRRLRFVSVKNVEAHGFGMEGIHLGAAGRSGFEDVRIEECLAYDNAHCGIYVAGPPRGWGGYAHANVVVRRCLARDNPGDPDASDENRSGSGIFLTGVDGAVVEACAASGNGARCRGTRGGPMGIWASESNRVAIQRCRSTGNRTGGRHDGGGFGLDGGMTNSILQYNYSSDNDGSGFGLFEYPGARAWHDNVVRYNVSENDGRRNGYAGIHVWNGGAGVRGAWVYHNTVVTAAAPQAQAKPPRALWVQTGVVNLRVMNNIFCAAQGVKLLDVAPEQAGIQFAGNCYWTTGGGLWIDWEGRAFSTFESWRRATGQERGTGSSLDPRFDNRGDGADRFRLAAASPLVDAAVTLPTDSGGLDFAGTSLPQGRRADVGAWETTGR